MNLDELLHEVRRIEKSRVVLTEKKIKKLYLSLWKKINGFLSDTWVKYSDNDGRLTVQQLKNAGKYAKFLEEIVKNVDTLSESEKMLVMGAVEETYKKTYQGMIKAVKKANMDDNLREVVKDINITPEVIKRAYDNNISKLTLAPIFQKNKAEITYNIQQALNVGLMNGDRYDTVAKRIQEKVNFSYDKAIRVVRTETHRNIESGFNDCAVNISEGLQGSGFVYTATWRTMKDERVRPQVRYYTAKRGWITKRLSNAKANHQAMEGQIIQVGDMFDLGNDVTAPCPGMSGTANNDCNCRCFVEYEMMTEDEFEKRKKNNVANSEKDDTIEYSEEFEKVKARCENANIEYIKVQPHIKSITEEEIIRNVGGGDETTGSCSSLAFAYIGNKAGYDVLDYRGGNSCEVFSARGTIRLISQFTGVKSKIVKGYNDFKAINELLKEVESDKEYYLATGRHAAIIRKVQNRLEFLELQDPDLKYNKFKPLTDERFKNRFKCQKTRTVFGQKVESSNILIDTESLYNNVEFKEILGYINTKKDKQQKGSGGYVK